MRGQNVLTILRVPFFWSGSFIQLINGFHSFILLIYTYTLPPYSSLLSNTSGVFNHGYYVGVFIFSCILFRNFCRFDILHFIDHSIDCCYSYFELSHHRKLGRTRVKDSGWCIRSRMRYTWRKLVMMMTGPQHGRSNKLKQIKSGVAEIGRRGRKQKIKTNQKV